MDAKDPRKLTTPLVRKRYGVTDMSLWRWQRDPELGFPQPVYIRGRRYWNESELDAWDARQPRGRGSNQTAATW